MPVTIVDHTAVVPAGATKPESVIFVHTEYQNRYIGTELLEHVIAYADHRKHDELYLNVSRGRPRAIDVYEKVGFSLTSTNVMDLEMALPLEEPIFTAVQQLPGVKDR